MSRFPESSLACLKRVLLARAPEFCFQATDVFAIVQVTWLNQAQISKWAENFMICYETADERIEFLESDGLEKVIRQHDMIKTYVTLCVHHSLLESDSII